MPAVVSRERGMYDPASGTWTATGSLTAARYVHTATLLPNGTVLVAGGHGPGVFPARNSTTRPAGAGVLRAPGHRTLPSHGDVAAQRPGAGGGRTLRQLS